MNNEMDLVPTEGKVINTLQAISRRRLLLTFSAMALFAAMGSGCGGSLGSSSTTTTRIRAVNGCPNGGTSTLALNGTQYFGTQNPFEASGYISITGTVGSTLMDTLSAPPSGNKYVSTVYDLAANTDYSVFLLGRADISANDVDVRTPRLVVTTDDQVVPPTGYARLRIVQAAPDGGSVDIAVNGTNVSTALAYGSVAAYQQIAGGTVAVTVKQAGTATVIASNLSLTLAAGTSYTLLVTETATTPTYGIQLLSDAR